GRAGGGGGSARRRRLGPVIGIAAAVIALVAVAGTYLSVQKPSPARAAGEGRTNSHSPAAVAPEHVLSMTPANGTQGVNGTAEIGVDFSEPLSATSPMPPLPPAIAGTSQP